jgi:hypothetical protein
MYKSGNSSKPSLLKLNTFIKQYGAASSEVSDYIKSFANDMAFCEAAEKLKQENIVKEKEKNE